MPLIAEELLIKIMAAAAVGGTVAGGGVVLNNYINNTPEKIEGRKVGLECGWDGICTLPGGREVTVKQGENTRTLSSIVGSGKIKINKFKESNKDKFFFSIEDGDIALKEVKVGESGSQTTKVDKLEEFETYEIEEGREADKVKHVLKRRSKVSDAIERKLGLTDAVCNLPAGTESSQSNSCSLNAEKLGKINFDGKNGAPTIAESGSTATLTISTLSDVEKGEGGSVKYPLGYRFELSGDKLVTIPTATGNITKEANGTIEFKIKKDGRNLSLEKLGNVERLAWKLGFSDCKEEGEGQNKTKTCKFPSTINVYKDNSNSVTLATVTEHTNKTITFTEEGATDYNGGVKFSLSSAVAITGGTKKGTLDNIETGNYEIKEQTVDTSKAWYLSKKTE